SCAGRCGRRMILCLQLSLPTATTLLAAFSNLFFVGCSHWFFTPQMMRSTFAEVRLLRLANPLHFQFPCEFGFIIDRGYGCNALAPSNIKRSFDTMRARHIFPDGNSVNFA